MSRFRTGVSYIDFHSVYMNADVTVGLDSDDGFITDVRIGEADTALYEHLTQSTLDKLEAEAQTAVAGERAEYAEIDYADRMAA